MIFTKETLTVQLRELLHQYPELTVVSESEKRVDVSGNILVNIKSNEYHLKKKYGIKIVIPLYSNKLPYVIDKDRYIPMKYNHIYNNGKLCLETDSAIRLRFVDGFDMVAWMKEYVEMYFFSYEYYIKYKCFPFGERSHGTEGIIQTYTDKFKTQNASDTLNVLSYINSHAYRGHDSCPCGSNMKLRNCHGTILLSIYSNSKIRQIIKNDYDLICEEYKNYGKNQNKTK